MAIGALSPALYPHFKTLRYPPGLCLNLGPISLNNFETASLDRTLEYTILSCATVSTFEIVIKVKAI